MSPLLRWLPLAMGLLVLGTTFVWRSWYHRRRFGSDGVARVDRTNYLGLLVSLVLGLLCWLAAVRPDLLRPLALPLPGLDFLPLLGAALVVVAVPWVLKAQVDLGSSWRIGIEEGARPGLVTGGLYRYSRNPIFSGVFALLAGFVLLLPDWLTLAIAVTSFVLIRLQVTREERWLTSTYGADYLAYAAKVGRFLPWIGRLS